MSEITKLNEVEMSADALQLGLFYIWVNDSDDTASIVWLSDCKEGISKYDTFGPITYYFEDNLIGQLYGPIDIPGAVPQGM